MWKKILVITLAVMLAATPALAWDWNEEAMKYMPLSDEMVDIYVMGQKFQTQAGEFENLDTYIWLKENGNVNITGERYLSDIWNEKVSLSIASGELPDAFLSTGWTSAQVAKYGEDGVLLEDVYKRQALHRAYQIQRPYRQLAVRGCIYRQGYHWH